jgi:hypothetical protein
MQALPGNCLTAAKAPAAVAPERRYGAPRKRKGWRTPRRFALTAPNSRQILDCGPPPLFQQGKKVTGGFNYSWPFVKNPCASFLHSIASEDRSVVKFFP